MPQAASAFSSEVITPEGLAALMERLQATDSPYGYKLERNGHILFVALASKDLPDMPEDMLAEAARLLGGRVRSRVVFLFEVLNEDYMEHRMMRAVAKAMAELWPVVLDNHAGTSEKVISRSAGGS